LIQPETLHGLLEHVVVLAHRLKVTRGRSSPPCSWAAPSRQAPPERGCRRVCPTQLPPRPWPRQGHGTRSGRQRSSPG
jgi:hypothetical protein